MQLFSLVYVSRATRDMSEDDLRDLLRASRSRNEKANITGMLLYRDGYFIQVLEGDEDVVNHVYAKIQKDKRHKILVVPHQQAIEKREFENWAMGFNHLDELDPSDLPAFSNFLEEPVNDEFFDHPSQVMTLLRAFRDKTNF